MAQRFDLTAQLQIQANTNSVNQAVARVKKQLSPISNVKMNVQTNARSLAQANKQVSQLNKGFKSSTRSASELNRTLVESARRFSVITIATGSLLSLANAFKRSVKEAIAFEAELVKISQVTGRSVSNLKGLSDEVTRLSTTLGVSSASLLNTSRILLQTGLSADKAKKALDVLAKTTLAATFDDIQSTTEGAIAILNQFGVQAAKTGNDIAFLEKSLDAINAVSKNFAVESGDLVSAIRRVGGVFANAGGSVEELVALFTSVRATTRESAETIATGLRTIFTRIQRAETIDQLKELGIVLQDSQGNFVGAFEAVQRLSKGLSGLDPRSFRFAGIVEELGGFRQIGKVIPLINQFTVAQQALNVAQNASGSINKDAQTAQQALATEISKTREQFDALIRTFADSSTFRSIITGALKLAQSFIKVAESLEPLLPLLTSLFALKAGQGLASGIGLLRGLRGGGSGVRASKFATGGMVPGTGNRDSVPAMLTPGEFVIRKQSVNKIGASNLAQMNARGYSKGGGVQYFKNGNRVQPGAGPAGNLTIQGQIGQIVPEGVPGTAESQVRNISVSDLLRKAPELQKRLRNVAPTDTISIAPKKIQVAALDANFSEDKVLKNGMDALDKSVYDAVPRGFKKNVKNVKVSKNSRARETLGGFAFETFAKAVLGASSGNPNDPFDIINSDNKLNKIAKKNPLARFLDAKRTKVRPGEIVDKALRERRVRKTLSLAKRKNRATGGGISGSDTVPAMLTPGEFVFNKSAAQSIGYANLNKMNKQGVTGYAQGGIVGVQKFATGGGVTSGSVRQEIKVGGLDALTKRIASVTQQMAKEEASLKILEQQRQPEIVEQKKHTQQIKDLNSSIAKLDAQYDQIAASSKAGAKGSKSLYRILDLRAKKEQEIVAAEARLANVNARLEKSELAMIATGDQLTAAQKKRASLISQARDLKQTATAGLTTGTQTNFRQASQQASFRTQGAAALPAATGGLGALGKNGQTAANYLQSFGASTKTTEAAIKLYEKIIKQGGTAQLALSKSMQLLTGKTAKQAQTSDRNIVEYLKAVAAEKNNNSLRKRLGGAMQTAITALGTVKGMVQNAASRAMGQIRNTAVAVGKAVAPAAKATQSLQMFAFFGTALSEAAGSALGLADAQKKALTQTAATAGVMLFFASTILDLASSFGEMGANAAEAGSSLASAGADAAQAGASTTAATAALALASAMAVATKSVLANAAANVASTATEQAEAAANAAAVAAEVAEVQANVGAVASEIAETKANIASAGSEMAKGASGLGSIIAGLAGPFIALMAVVGAVYVVMSYFSNVAKATAQELSKISSELITRSSEKGDVSATELVRAASAAGSARDEATVAAGQTSAATTGALVGGGTALAIAGAAAAFGASVGSVVPIVGTLIGGLVGAVAGLGYYALANQENTDAVIKHKMELEAAANSFVKLNNATQSVNKRLQDIANLPISQEEQTTRRLDAQEGLSATQFKGFNEAGAQLTRFTGPLKKTTVAISALSVEELTKLGEEAGLTGDQIETLKISQATYNNSLKGLTQSVNETRQTLQGAADIDLRDVDLDNFNRFEEQTTAFGRALQANERAIIADANARASEANKLGNAEGAKKIQQDANKLIAEQRAAYKQQQVALEENEARLREEAAARVGVLNVIRQQQKTLNDINNATKGFQQQLSATEAFIANLNGQVAKVDIPDVDLGENLPIDQLESNLDRFLVTISSLSPELQAAGKEAADALRSSRKLIEEGFDAAVGLNPADVSADMTPDQLLSVLGIDEGALLNAFGGVDSSVQQFKKRLQEFAKDGLITPEEAKQLFDPVREANSRFADQVTGLTGTVRAQADALRAETAKTQAIRDKNIQNLNNYNNVVAKGAEILAQAQGKSVASVRQRSEARSRQATLDAGQEARGGTKLDGQNIAQLAQAKKLADAQLAVIRSKLQEARASGANAQTIANLEAKQQQLINTSNDAKEALEGIANSSAKLEVLQEKLAKASQAREQAFAVMEEFVVGGESTRQSLQAGAVGISSAVRTGTIQNQTEEQRSQTVALLDKLKDVQIGDTGLTGQEVKQELVFRDAVRLGFPPEIAKELATSTSTEEQILDELRKQTALQQTAAAKANDIDQGAAQFARGGVVYRSGGGSIFQPKGTDTVPAMLTPGEFVIRKSAVDRIGAGNLAALNNGNGVVYRARGSVVPEGGINAANAVTKDKGQQIAFPDSQQVRDLLNRVASEDPAGFVKLMTSSGYIDRAQRGLFQTLIRSGNFEPRRALKALDSKTRLLSSIESGKEYLKENVSSLTASGIDVMPGKDVDDVITNIENYSRNNITKLTEGPAGQVLSELSRRGGFDIVGGFQKLLGLAGGGDGNAAAVKSTTGTVSTAGGARVAKAVQQLVEAGVYLSQGGGVDAADSIPAMLTPGEFVMSPEAVQKYGVGYMRSLNRGTVPGFRRGGMVGSGNVRYRANGSSGPESAGGGTLSVDTSNLQEVLTGFSASFTESINNVIGTFNTLNTSMTALANAINGGMVITHQFSGDMKMAFNIQNADHLKNAIAEALTPKISEIIRTEIENRLDGDFQVGGG